MRSRIMVTVCVVLLAVSTPLLAGCGELVVGSGELVTETYDFKDFTRIELTDAFDAEIERGDAFEVEITVDDNLVDRLEVEQDGDTLRIGLESGISLGTTTTEATILLPELRGVALSGAATAGVAGFASAEPFEIRLSGAGRLVLTDVSTGDVDLEASGASEVEGALTAGDMRCEASGASSIELQGSADAAVLEGSGASRFGLASFTLQSADVRLSGASEAELDVRLTLDVDLSGASSLQYAGDPDLADVEVSGGSQIERRGD